MQLTTLKEKFGGQTIAAIEADLDRHHDQVRTGMQGFFAALYYLRRTGRFRENPVFAKATFDDYLAQRFFISRRQYDKVEWAFHKFPEEAARLGPQTVDLVRRKCGAKQAPRVLAEIKQLDTKSKKPVTIDRVYQVIDKHEIPKKPAPVVMGAADLRRLLDQREETISFQRYKIQRLEKQVARLKNAVLKYKTKKGTK